MNFLILCITFFGGYITGVVVTFLLEILHERKAMKDFERESTFNFTVNEKQAKRLKKLKKTLDKGLAKSKWKAVKP